MHERQYSLFKSKNDIPTGEIIKEKVEDAIYKSSGYIYRAARILDVRYDKLYKYVQKDDNLKELINILRKRNKEIVEEQLTRKAVKGNIAAIRNYLQYFDTYSLFDQNIDNDINIKVEIEGIKD